MYVIVTEGFVRFCFRRGDETCRSPRVSRTNQWFSHKSPFYSSRGSFCFELVSSVDWWNSSLICVRRTLKRLFPQTETWTEPGSSIRTAVISRTERDVDQDHLSEQIWGRNVKIVIFHVQNKQIWPGPARPAPSSTTCCSQLAQCKTTFFHKCYPDPLWLDLHTYCNAVRIPPSAGQDN